MYDNNKATQLCASSAGGTSQDKCDVSHTASALWVQVKHYNANSHGKVDASGGALADFGPG